MARESSLWIWLKSARLKYRGTLHMNRVENSVSAGMPDVEGQLKDHAQFWIELKSAPRPKGDGPVAVKIRDAQVEWLRRRDKAGGNAWLLIQVGSAAKAKRYLVLGMHAARIQAGVTEAELADLAYTSGAIKPYQVIRAAG